MPEKGHHRPCVSKTPPCVKKGLCIRPPPLLLKAPATSCTGAMDDVVHVTTCVLLMGMSEACLPKHILSSISCPAPCQSPRAPVMCGDSTEQLCFCRLPYSPQFIRLYVNINRDAFLQNSAVNHTVLYYFHCLYSRSHNEGPTGAVQDVMISTS